jgi:hypothetical protein
MSRRLNERIKRIAKQLEPQEVETIVWAPWYLELMSKPAELEPTASTPALTPEPAPAPAAPPLTPVAQDAGIAAAQCPQCGSTNANL